MKKVLGSGLFEKKIRPALFAKGTCFALSHFLEVVLVFLLELLCSFERRLHCSMRAVVLIHNDCFLFEVCFARLW